MTTQIRESKTEELIEELKESGRIVGVEDLSRYLRESGVVVTEHVGRRRSHVEVSAKMYGVDLSTKTDETRQFFSNHVKSGKLTFIDTKLDRSLTNIEGALRIARKRAAIGYDGKFMVMSAYKEFNELFEIKKAEYFALRDKIVSDWDEMIENFKKLLENSLTDLNSVDKEKLIANVMHKVPTKEEYSSSFYMNVNINAFPVVENLDMFDESIREKIKDGMTNESIQSMYQIIGNGLDEAFFVASSLLTNIEQNGKVNGHSLNAAKNASLRLRQKNVFGNNKVDELADMVEIVGDLHDVDEIAEFSEKIIAKSYGYADELGITSMLRLNKSPFEEVDIMDIYESMGGKDSWVCLANHKELEETQ